MRKFRSALFAAAAFTSLVASLVFTSLSTTHGAADKDVRVVNTAAEVEFVSVNGNVVHGRTVDLTSRSLRESVGP